MAADLIDQVIRRNLEIGRVPALEAELVLVVRAAATPGRRHGNQILAPAPVKQYLAGRGAVLGQPEMARGLLERRIDDGICDQGSPMLSESRMVATR